MPLNEKSPDNRSAEVNLNELQREFRARPGVAEVLKAYEDSAKIVRGAAPYTIRNGRVVTFSSSDRTSQ